MYDELLLEEEQVAPADTGWGEVPDERDAATKEFDRQIEMLRREEEAKKTDAQRQAEAEEEEARKAADAKRMAALNAALNGPQYGLVKRPGGTWKTASEHHADEREHWQRAQRSRGLVAVQEARQELVGTTSRQRPQTNAREPRRQHGRGRAHRAHGPPSAGNDDPDPPSSTTWDYLTAASRRMLEHERRREANWRKRVAA